MTDFKLPPNNKMDNKGKLFVKVFQTNVQQRIHYTLNAP